MIASIHQQDLGNNYKKKFGTSFKEKPQIKLVDKRRFFCYGLYFSNFKNDKEILENPLEKLSRLRKLSVFRHNGF